MEVVAFKLKYVPEVLSWVKTEADMVQWAGHSFVWPLTQRQFREHLKGRGMPLSSLYPFALLLRGRLVGYCELSNHRRSAKSAMLSRVIIAPRRRGRGLGAFMVRDVLRFGFSDLELNRIDLGVFDFNEAAIRCYKRIGFVHEGTLRQSAKVGDSYWNCHLMSILREEWTDGGGVIPTMKQSG